MLSRLETYNWLEMDVMLWHLKVGGLGDVLTGLSRSLLKKGHLVEIILPKYDCMAYTCIKSLKELDLELHAVFDGKKHKNKVWLAIVEGLPVYLIEPLHPAKFFWQGQFYGEPDDFKRFTYFCRA
jgi:starch synthase